MFGLFGHVVQVQKCLIFFLTWILCICSGCFRSPRDLHSTLFSLFMVPNKDSKLSEKLFPELKGRFACVIFSSCEVHTENIVGKWLMHGDSILHAFPVLVPLRERKMSNVNQYWLWWFSCCKVMCWKSMVVVEKS